MAESEREKQREERDREKRKKHRKNKGKLRWRAKTTVERVERGNRERERENLCFDIKGIENSHGRLLSNHRTNVCNELARSR